ncbi:MAG: DUF4340 domain-containing protein [Clostridia bacterium]|nr:DUF4340 domain-containing protein [Clostridia bacterium]
MTEQDKNDIQNGNTEEAEKSTIFSAPEEPKPTLDQKRRASALKKQGRLIFIMAIIVVAAICAYFFVVLPIVNYVEEVTEETVELLEGEVLGTNDRILIFDHYERKDIKSIEIHNEYGEYGFYYDETDEAFYVIDHPAAPYSKELFSSLVVSTGYTLSMERVTMDCEDMSEYGLAEDQNPAWYTLTTHEGEEHTVYIGDLIPSGGGYYVRYKDRNAVYVLDTTIGNTVLMPLENMITAMLTLPMNTNDYFTIKNFAVMQGDDVNIMLTYLDEEAKEAAASTSAYQMIYPAGYAVNTTSYTTVLEVLTNFTGTSTLAYAPTEEELTEYGLLDPAFSIYYEYQEIEQFVVFSEKNENGNYYAYSPLFDLVTELDGTTMAWLEWDLIKWVDTPIFMMNINDVATITVESETATRIYDLVGEAQELVVTERETDFKPEVQNYRQFYKALLSIYLQGYATDDISEDEVTALKASEPYLTLTIETRAGKITEYKFYPYSTRRAYYTVNGEGQFYVLRDMATKIISDCEKVMTNTEIDSEAHS